MSAGKVASASNFYWIYSQMLHFKTAALWLLHPFKDALLTLCHPDVHVCHIRPEVSKQRLFFSFQAFKQSFVSLLQEAEKSNISTFRRFSAELGPAVGVWAACA